LREAYPLQCLAPIGASKVPSTAKRHFGALNWLGEQR
jgi:hypothetical protein